LGFITRKKTDLITHLMRRNELQSGKAGVGRIILGDMDILEQIREMTHTCIVSIKMFIVQPGLSKKTASVDQMQLLGVTDNYLNETYQIELAVICSK